MFAYTLDSEIGLLLLQESMDTRLCQLVNENREYLAKWLPWVPNSQTPQHYQAYIKQSLTQYANGQAVECAIEYQGIIVGVCGFKRIDRHLGVAELAYWLGEAYQGNGVMTRACLFMLKYAFNELGMQKVQLSAAIDNKPSRKIANRLGMELEGVIRRQERVGDQVLDHAVYGIMKEDLR